MVEDYLKRKVDALMILADSFARLRFSFIILPLMFAGFSLFVAFPSYDLVYSHEMSENWKAVLAQIDDPFNVPKHPPGSHAANLSFRLTPVLIGVIFQVHSIGYFIFLQVIAFVLMFVVLYKLFLKISKDHVTSFFLCLSMSLVFIGNVLCSDYRGFFDVFAFLFLGCTLLFEFPFLIALFGLLAYFTDERALICSPLIYLFFVVEKQTGNTCSRFIDFFRFNGKMIALFASWILYVAMRYFIATRFHLGANVEGLVDYLKTETIHQINSLPLGIWTGLEGFWILIVVAVIIIVQMKGRQLLFSYMASMTLVTLTAFWVFDMTRSMAYLMPAIFLSLHLISRVYAPRKMRYVALVVFLCCLFPTYYVGGPKEVTWFYPLPIQVLRMVFF